MSELGVLAAAFGFGIASAIIPVLNAEAYTAVNVVAFGRPMIVGMVLALSVGTVIGKIVVFQGARAGKRIVESKEPRERAKPPGRLRRGVARVSAVLMSWLDQPVLGGVTVFVSAFAGIPPLLAVAVVAGASKQNVWLFSLAVFAGRAIRFGTIAGGVALVGDVE